MSLVLCCIVLAGSACSSKKDGTASVPEGSDLRPAAAHGASPAPTGMGAGGQVAGAGLKFTAPDGWVAEKPTSSMRQAQYRLPKAAGDSEDAELVVFYFQGGGGGVQANIDRWVGQFAKPDGSPVTDAKTSHKTAHGIALTIVDVTGTYVAGMGSASDGKQKDRYRMLGAVAEAGSGPWFFKLIGPEKTVTRWEPGFQSFLDSIQ
jgi:hypothetical protein